MRKKESVWFWIREAQIWQPAANKAELQLVAPCICGCAKGLIMLSFKLPTFRVDFDADNVIEFQIEGSLPWRNAVLSRVKTAQQFFGNLGVHEDKLYRLASMGVQAGLPLPQLVNTANNLLTAWRSDRDNMRLGFYCSHHQHGYQFQACMVMPKESFENEISKMDNMN